MGLRVIGLMSGTSLDGLSVGYVDVEAVSPVFKAEFIAGRTYRFPPSLREGMLRIAESTPTKPRAYAELSRRLGIFCARKTKSFIKAEKLEPPELVGFHGQTVYHSGRKPFVATYQLGDPSPICYELMVPVVSDFRSMDIAAGGQGAPLVAIVDYLKYRSEQATRAVVNLGGISNLTLLPKACGLGDVLAFDTGPGMMVIDAAFRRLIDPQKMFDEGGRVALTGRVSEKLLDAILKIDDYRLQPIPKTTGRERYGKKFLDKVLVEAHRHGVAKEDVITTLSYYTSYMVNHHLALLGEKGFKVDEIIVGGGGSKNTYIMTKLRENTFGAKLSVHDQYGVPRDHYESFAFAVLGYLSFNGFAGNTPSATGASRAVLLGRINFPAYRTLK
ncbi:MAG: anhydro-N-acetylmuramic acid kinase [Thermoprotei archaeon]